MYHYCYIISIYLFFLTKTVVLTHIQSDVTHRSVSRSSLGQENLIHVDQGNKIFGFAAIAILGWGGLSGRFGFDTSFKARFFLAASHVWFHIANNIYLYIYKYISWYIYIYISYIYIIYIYIIRRVQVSQFQVNIFQANLWIHDTWNKLVFAFFSTLGTTIHLGFLWTQKPMGFTRSMTLNDP